MKPLQLTMQAFGPYASREVIDFRELENRTMFVISGKTGAGKTTIFDGISYAIYGKASGKTAVRSI
ncbi:AAA family ATPase [Rossellomorea sp. H39__3]